MCIYSKFWNEWEKINLAPYAIHSDHPWYTKRLYGDDVEQAIDRCGNRSRYRTAFEIDKDRITNSQAFRRLEYKTQVFVTHEGDNFRTRLTHTLEVAEIARHIARSLRLNESLVEAIALGHDLGHSPYGHVAEDTINEWLKAKGIKNFYFCHNRNSVEIIDHLEPGYDWDNRHLKKGFAIGLNLSYAVREGVLTHTSRSYLGPCHFGGDFNGNYDEAIRFLAEANKEKEMFFPGSLEAQVVRISDVLAHRIHDLEDGLRSNMISKKDILKAILQYIRTQKNSIFDPESIESGPTLNHSKHEKTKISKIFIDQIIDLYNSTKKDSNAPDQFLKKPRKKQPSLAEKISEINKRLVEDKDYRRLFLIVAVVAFSLHMWRNDRYLSNITNEDRSASRTRILKYFNLVMKMYRGFKRGDHIPAYNLVAFLRGTMLANVIEHSFWKIHRLLNPEFRHVTGASIKIPDKRKIEKNDTFCLIFIIVDGICKKQRKNMTFIPNKDERRYCFKFKSEDEADKFIKDHFRKILESNGEEIESLRSKYKSDFFFASKIIWLNRNEDPRKTEYVIIEDNDKDEIVLPLKNTRIFFTGYKDFCPGLPKNRPCRYSTPQNHPCARTQKSCDFYKDEINYPDINRLIEIQDDLLPLDRKLNKLINERIHGASRIARMNYMGKKIINELLDEYLSNPRLMHDRVWSRLRSYQNNPNLSKPVKWWCDKPILKRERLVVPGEVIDHLTDELKVNNKLKWEANRFSFIRRIIEYLSGMTDRFIANEYNRINQSGREVEIQDETYFFS